jgi:xanthine dehydrogenase accessory factor
LLFQGFDASAAAALATLAHRIGAGEALAIATAVTRESAGPIVVAPDASLPPAVLVAGEALLRDAQPQVVADDAGTSWFVERAAGNAFRVTVFGNGHVGRALVQVLGALPCAVTWVDEREADFPATAPPNVSIVVTDIPEAEVRAAAAGSMFLVMTHSHALDFDLVAAIVTRGDFAYAGMIGSAAKRAQMERRLRERGVDTETIARVACPIGIAGIHGREPGAIAVAVAAELLQLRECTAAERAGSGRRAGQMGPGAR